MQLDPLTEAYVKNANFICDALFGTTETKAEKPKEDSMSEKDEELHGHIVEALYLAKNESKSATGERLSKLSSIASHLEECYCTSLQNLGREE